MNFVNCDPESEGGGGESKKNIAKCEKHKYNLLGRKLTYQIPKVYEVLTSEYVVF